MPLKLLAAVLLASVCASSAQYPQLQSFGMSPYLPPPPAPRLPMVLMPRHSKSLDEKRDRIHRGKKRKSHHHHHHHSRRAASHSSEESNGKYFAFRSKKRRDPLTAVLSYVNKNGYVLYQKRLGRNPALPPPGAGRGAGRGGARGGRDYDGGDSEEEYDDSELDYDDIPEEGDDF